jgi:hypothetical protein
MIGFRFHERLEHYFARKSAYAVLTGAKLKNYLHVYYYKAPNDLYYILYLTHITVQFILVWALSQLARRLPM